MSAKPTSGQPSSKTARRSLLVVAMLALSLVLSAVLSRPASASGQPNLGFMERDGSERFWVMGPDWTVRANLVFTSAETVRVNVSSATVDVIANAGGGGAVELNLQRYDGNVAASTVFTQATSGASSLYTASIDLSSLVLTPDWYFLRIFIDDTQGTFEAISAIRVGPGPVHSIETYSDDTFQHPSDVFTTTSTIWVRIVGEPGADQDRWDVYEFLDGNSRVNGPNANFDNFAAVGDVYTFSIDLSTWVGALPQWWSYTLSVRLSGGAFEGGKQIQILDPDLSISWAVIAPAQARQGQTDVPMLALTLSLPANWADGFGPAAYNLERIRIVRTGAPGTNADVAGVHIWEDMNGNGALDAGDVRLASRTALGGVAFPAWVGTNGRTMTTVESSAPRYLLVTFDIAPNAAVGDFAGARINGFGDIDMHGHFASIAGLPVQSTNVEILAADVLAVTNDPGQAPGLAARGAVGVPVDLLTFETNGATVTVNELSVELRGTGTAQDVLRVYLRIDDGNGVYDPATDVALGPVATFPASGPAVFRGLGYTATAAGGSVWIAFDVSPTATIGAEIGTRIASNASVVVSGGSVFGGTFPLDSGLVRIRGPLLTARATDLAPAQVPIGRVNVPMLRLEMSVDAGQTTVVGLAVDKRGSSPSDADVSAVKLYRDADADRTWSSADQLLDASIFVAGTTVFGPINVVVASADPIELFVVLDIAASATVGSTVGVELRDETYVRVDADSIVDPGPFALRSSDSLIVSQVLGAISGTVSDATGNPLVGVTVEIAELAVSTTTDALGAYSFTGVPMGTYHVVTRLTGYVDDNKTVVLDSASPNKVVNFVLAKPAAGLDAGAFLLIAIVAGLGLAALLGLLLVMGRRRARCPVCGKPKARDREVCAECEGKGLRPGMSPVPPPPPPAP